MRVEGQAVEYTHDGITISFGEAGETRVASDTTVIRHGVTVYATTDTLIAPSLADLGAAIATHAAAIEAAGRPVSDTDAFVECRGEVTWYLWRVTYAGDPLRRPEGVMSFD